MLKVSDLRKSYTDYFKNKEHKIIHSSPLIPKDDPTLLFTTAGMVQFKPMFAGTVKLDYTRAASVQKCLRTSDLENVGKTKRHCTFFEMLGNFSFGDYFKTEAIEWAWDYSVNVLGFDKNKLWVSIYENDDEAYDLWHNSIKVPADRIVRLGKKDNFWGPAGNSGACGPCSELYIDKGEEYGCGDPNCKPGCDCERYMEYWNLVFNQFFQDENGVQTKLPKTGIDTGMGLERLATICQGVSSIYETDELKRLVDYVSEKTGIPYEGKNIVAINVIVEHSRALTFAMTDGAYPSNEGRGYVLRRILRRALRFTRQLGITEPFVYKMVEPIVNIMGDFYPEIISAKKNIEKVLMAEEARFLETLDKGMNILDDIISKHEKGAGVISGKDAFTLYDTYGFPVEMTNEIALENNLTVDTENFNKEMMLQRERGKKSWKAADNVLEKSLTDNVKSLDETIFLGYEKYSSDASIIAIAGGDSFSSTKTISANETGYIILDNTPFYGESGGQSGDTGEISNGENLFEVQQTKKFNKRIIHLGMVKKGTFNTGDSVTAEINCIRRNLTKANHTVTHLLQAALREVLGNHVKQAGSLVEEDRMRFDFSHFAAMTNDEISRVENIVNAKIWENLTVTAREMPLQDALKLGAMAEFGEKYEDTVRVISAGNFSMELCGGTHVGSTGLIGVFKILKEFSPGAGTRRIEGVTLKTFYERANKYEDIVSGICKTLNINEKDAVNKISELYERNIELEKNIAKFQSEKLSGNVDEMLNNAPVQLGIKIISAIYDKTPVDDLKNLCDNIRGKDQNVVIVFGTSADDKASLVCAASKNAVEKGIDCGIIIREASSVVGGKGGGRKDMAQAGGKDITKLNDAIAKAVTVIKDMIK